VEDPLPKQTGTFTQTGKLQVEHTVGKSEPQVVTIRDKIDHI
jgi:hypothetical protein